MSIKIVYFPFRLAALMEVIRPSQGAENPASERMTSGSSSSSTSNNIQHGMTQVGFKVCKLIIIIKFINNDLFIYFNFFRVETLMILLVCWKKLSIYLKSG